MSHKGSFAERESIFSRTLTAERVKRGMTQRQFGALIGVTSTCISCWELGAYKPTEESLIQISRALGVSQRYLTTGIADSEFRWKTYDKAGRGHTYCPYCNHRQAWTIREAEWNYGRTPRFCSWCGREVDGS